MRIRSSMSSKSIFSFNFAWFGAKCKTSGTTKLPANSSTGNLLLFDVGGLLLRNHPTALKRSWLSRLRTLFFLFFSHLGGKAALLKAKGFSGFSPRSLPHDVIGGLASIYSDGLNPSLVRGPTIRNLLPLKRRKPSRKVCPMMLNFVLCPLPVERPAGNPQSV